MNREIACGIISVALADCFLAIFMYYMAMDNVQCFMEREF